MIHVRDFGLKGPALLHKAKRNYAQARQNRSKLKLLKQGRPHQRYGSMQLFPKRKLSKAFDFEMIARKQENHSSDGTKLVIGKSISV